MVALANGWESREHHQCDDTGGNDGKGQDNGVIHPMLVESNHCGILERYLVRQRELTGKNEKTYNEPRERCARPSRVYATQVLKERGQANAEPQWRPLLEELDEDPEPGTKEEFAPDRDAREDVSKREGGRIPVCVREVACRGNDDSNKIESEDKCKELLQGWISPMLAINYKRTNLSIRVVPHPETRPPAHGS
jgi:hypothetical protein